MSVTVTGSLSCSPEIGRPIQRSTSVVSSGTISTSTSVRLIASHLLPAQWHSRCCDPSEVDLLDLGLPGCELTPWDFGVNHPFVHDECAVHDQLRVVDVLLDKKDGCRR